MMSTQERIETTLLLSALFFERKYRLEKVQANLFLTDYGWQDPAVIEKENRETDLELLDYLANPNYTPPHVTELHVEACEESGITQCICSTYKDTTAPQKGSVL